MLDEDRTTPGPVTEAAASGQPAGGDWASRLTRLIGTGVELVRDKSVRPATIVAAGIVVALGVAGAGAVAVILAVAGIARLLEEGLGHEMWAVYTLFGGIFTLGGMLVIVVGNRVTRL